MNLRLLLIFRHELCMDTRVCMVSMVIAYLLLITMRRGVVAWNRVSIINELLLLLLKKLLLQESFFLSFLAHLFSHLMTRRTENALHYATEKKSQQCAYFRGDMYYLAGLGKYKILDLYIALCTAETICVIGLFT